MILSQVRTTIRDLIIELGYTEWTGFLSEEVPETILEQTFHVGVTSGVGNGINMHVLPVENRVVLTLWKKGYRNAVEAQDAGLTTIQEIMCHLLNPITRTRPAYRKIGFDSYDLLPIDLDNDSICKITMNLTVEVIVEVTQSV